MGNEQTERKGKPTWAIEVKAVSATQTVQGQPVSGDASGTSVEAGDGEAVQPGNAGAGETGSPGQASAAPVSEVGADGKPKPEARQSKPNSRRKRSAK